MEECAVVMEVEASPFSALTDASSPALATEASADAEDDLSGSGWVWISRATHNMAWRLLCGNELTWSARPRRQHVLDSTGDRRQAYRRVVDRATAFEQLDLELPVEKRTGQQSERRRRRIVPSHHRTKDEHRPLAALCKYLETTKLFRPGLGKPSHFGCRSV